MNEKLKEEAPSPENSLEQRYKELSDALIKALQPVFEDEVRVRKEIDSTLASTQNITEAEKIAAEKAIIEKHLFSTYKVIKEARKNLGNIMRYFPLER